MNKAAGMPPGPIALALLQSRFCLMNLGGEVRVIDRDQFANTSSSGSSSEVAFYKKSDGELLMKRALEKVGLPVNVKLVISDFWVDPSTHVYCEVAFSPKVVPATTLNYWVGPSVAPAPGNWALIGNFIREVVCGGDAALHSYLIKYLAHMLQRPEEKSGVFIVLLGLQGTGKGAFFTLLRRIWAKTTLFVSDIDNVIGHFNAALERHYVVCMDEALFSGDKKALERLKSLITEPVCRIEQKYQPARTIDSYHRFFAASNSDHFAHVERDDRRFLFLRVSSFRQGDMDYFSQLHQGFDDASVIAAMVHDLLQVDLSHFDIRKRPKTGEHMSQKLQSLTGFERYWFEVLQSGHLSGTDDSPLTGIWSAEMFVPTSKLISSFKEFDKNAQRYRTVQSQQIATSLGKLCPSAGPARNKSQFGQQVRGYQLPSLQVARSEFEASVGGVVPWDAGEAINHCQEALAFTANQLAEPWDTHSIDDSVQPIKTDVTSGSGTPRMSGHESFQHFDRGDSTSQIISK